MALPNKLERGHAEQIVALVKEYSQKSGLRLAEIQVYLMPNLQRLASRSE